jgi:hypothetical protein
MLCCASVRIRPDRTMMRLIRGGLTCAFNRVEQSGPALLAPMARFAHKRVVPVFNIDDGWWSVITFPMA